MNLQDVPINYHLLGEAQSYYARNGYSKIEVPWIVPAVASLVTTPHANMAYAMDDGKHLVGSGEQGFIHLLSQMNPEDEYLERNKCYQTVTPCFRRDIVDHLHSNWFMKLELFCWITNGKPMPVVHKMFNDAAIFLDNLLLDVDKVEEGECCFDLCSNGIELGSYGFRSATVNDKTFTWAYGTGLALPRVQYSMNNKTV